MKNGLLIFSAPSGSGKSTIVNWLMKEHPELKLAFSISCTSRAPRGTEQNGVEYFFLSPEEFKAKIEADEFLEYEEVYQDRFYGTLKSQVENQLAKGESVIFDVDVKGGVNIKKFYGERALSIFVQPPSVEELRRRLVGRNTDAPEVIEQRLAKASYELTFAPQFDHVVVNDDLEKAQQEVYQLVKAFLGAEYQYKRKNKAACFANHKVQCSMLKVQSMKVGIFGGSFNPIHTGHIALAKSLCEKACLDEVWFMVSPMNPFKKTATDLLDDQLRLEMVEKALEHEPQLKACDYEFRLPKPSYTWHTLQAISKDYPENEFTLLIGGDNWAAFDKWYHHDDILAHYPIVVYPRQGASIGNVPEGVTIVETPLLNISSTEIRKRIKEEESIRGMVPECIEQLAVRNYRQL